PERARPRGGPLVGPCYDRCAWSTPGVGLGSRGRSWCYILLAGLLTGACAHGSKVAVSPAPPPAPPAPEDPVAKLIGEADLHLAAGMTSAKDGHLERAREEFDRAVDLYLGAPGGAGSEPRLLEAYRRTIEAIHLREMETLAAGDGFTEAGTEP